MPISKSAEVFNLIKSLSKAEKRNFKLYANRNQNQGQLKFIDLFELLDKSEQYDENLIIETLQGVPKSKLSNLKRHLYTQILSSLRVITVSKRPNIEVREMIDFAYILYDKAFYLQAIKILEKAKRLANKYYLYHMHLVIIEFEKRIESRHITRSGKEKAYILIEESRSINKKISTSIHLSNLRTDLHAKYLKNGHYKSIQEKIELEQFFSESIKDIKENQLGPVEKVYLYQSYVWFHHILLDFTSCLAFAEKWLFSLEEESQMIERDVDLYLRAYHYILSSCYHLRDKDKLEQYLNKIEAFRNTNYKKFNALSQIISFQYVHSARLNKIIINGDYENGQEVISKTLRRIKRYKSKVDPHKILVFYFKIAWIYFGNEKYSKAIVYLNKIIINELPKLREDLQIYSRLLFLMTHYELRNYDVFKYAIQSFKKYFNTVDSSFPVVEILQSTFLALAKSHKSNHTPIMKEALVQLKIQQKDQVNKISFSYLDMISWLESKITNKTMSSIIKSKTEMASKL